MKNILIVTSNCFGNVSANGVCSRNLADAFETFGIQSFILGVVDSDVKGSFFLRDNEFAIYKPKPNQASKPSFFKKLKNVIHFSIKPKFDVKTVTLLEEGISNLIEEKRIDSILSIYYPIEAVIAVSRIKKKHPNCFCATYELDSATDGILSNSRFQPLFDRAQMRFLKKQYRVLDASFVMQSHKEHVKKLYGDVLGEKLVVTDLPVLTEKKSSQAEQTEEIRFLYAGILDRVYRSPKVLLELFLKNPDFHEWRLHFFSRGNCEEDLRKAAERDSRICCHGYVPTDELDRAIDQAEVLVSIGNANSNSVPSKIINYISYGKPIVHFSLQKNDVCSRYFGKYPLALVIPFGTDSRIATDMIKAFVAKQKGKRILFSEIKQSFEENLPEYSAELIARFGDRS